MHQENSHMKTFLNNRSLSREFTHENLLNNRSTKDIFDRKSMCIETTILDLFVTAFVLTNLNRNSGKYIFDRKSLFIEPLKIKNNTKLDLFCYSISIGV